MLFVSNNLSSTASIELLMETCRIQEPKATSRCIDFDHGNKANEPSKLLQQEFIQHRFNF